MLPSSVEFSTANGRYTEYEVVYTDELRLKRIPAHSGMEGNKAADQETKNAKQTTYTKGHHT
jgi:ribonuclease HI